MKPGNRTLSFRVIVIGVAAMVVMGLWIHFHEVLLPRPNLLAENSPPAGAVGIFLGVFLISGLLAWFRPALRLDKGELLSVYTMLIIAAPLMSQGMWHRFLGLVVAIPHHVENMPLVDSYSEKLWPHGKHLVENRRFDRNLKDAFTAAPSDRVRVVPVTQSPVGACSALELRNPFDPKDAGRDAMETTARIRIDRHRQGREALVPGERYFATALFRISGFRSASRLLVELVSATGERVSITTLGRNTSETRSQPGGFRRMGQPYVSLPQNLGDFVEIVFTLTGPGRAEITDVTFFSNEAIARLHRGASEIRESDLPRLAENSREALLVRPDHLASPAGIWYALKGSIPYEQWATPLLYWVSIVMAMFLGLLGLGIIFRKQWADNERFPFPLVVIPRMLLNARQEGTSAARRLFSGHGLKFGVLFAFAYCLLQGLAFYVPGLPDPTVKVNLADYVSSPPLKALVSGFAGNGEFNIVLLFVSIAFFVELDMLLSILVCFGLARIPFYLGEAFGWRSIRGPVDSFPFPHEQHIGAFLSLALIVLWVSRRHLAGVGRRILGLSNGVDDSREAMSYRSAFLLLAGAFVFFAFWGAMSGLGAGGALLFFGFLIVCGLSASRIRTECGAPFTYFTPYYPYLIFFLFGGLFTFSLQTMLLAFVAGGFMAVAQFLLFAPTQVEMLHLAETEGVHPRQISWALVAGALGGVLLGGYFMMVWAYGKGSENIPYMNNWAVSQNWYFNPLRDALTQMDVPSMNTASPGTGSAAVYPSGPLAAVGVGCGMTLLLSFLRMQFVGFWIHPIGYVLANTFFIHACWGSILVAWMIKGTALKIGGPRLIRETLTPWFVGVFLGGVVGMAFWDGVALVALSQGSRDVFTCWP